MADPFDALRQPVVPLSPRPEFAAALRARLRSHLDPPARSWVRGLTPYLSVSDAAAAIDWYSDVFGAVVTTRLTGPDGRVAHSELRIGRSMIMVAEEYEVEDVISPARAGGTTVQMQLEVDDCDAVFDRAVGAGARVWRPVGDAHPGARGGKVQDPWGHNWFIDTTVEDLSPQEMASRFEEEGFQTAAADRTGDLFYFTWRMGDLGVARDFFAAVLGWEYSPAHVDGVTVVNTNQPIGLRAGGADLIRLWFCVADIHAAVARVRDLGGRAEEPVLYATGWSADCVTPDGVAFGLSVPAPGY